MINCGPGWITKAECEFHRKYMKNSTGKILEGGAFGGKLFGYLQPIFKEWEYHAVNAWTEHPTYIPANEKLTYFLDPNVKSHLPENIMTLEKFKKYCPYAIATDGLFETYETENKFDLISIGQVHTLIDMKEQYRCAAKLLKPDGIIIARNLQIKRHTKNIHKAIKKNKLQIIEVNDSVTCAACRIRKN